MARSTQRRGTWTILWQTFDILIFSVLYVRRGWCRLLLSFGLTPTHTLLKTNKWGKKEEKVELTNKNFCQLFQNIFFAA